MRKAAGLVGIGVLCLALGFYILPFGYDILLNYLIELGGGDYWTGTLYAYMLSVGLIFAGVLLARPAWVSKLISPQIAVALIAVVALGYFVLFAGGA
jgi:hypothetical protein